MTDDNMQNEEPANENLQAEDNASENSNPYQLIIDQQQSQIEALIQQTKTLNEQIVTMVASGAQFNQQQTQQPQTQQIQTTFNPVSLANQEDYTLESLAKEIGKRE